jgi:hypothetical protein
VAHALVRAASTLVSMLVHSADLNASIHVRALLTDLFLIDEILKWGKRAPWALLARQLTQARCRHLSRLLVNTGTHTLCV